MADVDGYLSAPKNVRVTIIHRSLNGSDDDATEVVVHGELAARCAFDETRIIAVGGTLSEAGGRERVGCVNICNHPFAEPDDLA